MCLRMMFSTIEKSYYILFILYGKNSMQLILLVKNNLLLGAQSKK